MTQRQVALRRLVSCLDGRRVPLNQEERSGRAGPIPYWGANGILDHIDEAIFDEELVLLGEDGAPFDDPLATIAFRVTGPTWINNHIHVLRPRSGQCPRYLTYALNAIDWMPHVTGSTRLKLTQDDMMAVTVPCPSPAQQRTIADYLDTETARIDALIAKKRRMIELLDEEKSSVMLSAVGGHLTSSGPLSKSTLPWLPEVPIRWPQVLLRLVARTGSGHTPSREHPEWWTDCTIPWITTGEVAQVRTDEVEVITETRERISELGMANSAAAVHPAGTVVLCRTASAGYSAIMGSDMATSQDFATWTCGPTLRPRFLLLCLRAMRGDLLGRLAMGSTHKTIYMPDIHSIRVPLPSLHEQNEIVDAAHRMLNRLFSARRLLNQQIELLHEHRQALITAAVTGELEIPGVAA